MAEHKVISVNLMVNDIDGSARGMIVATGRDRGDDPNFTPLPNATFHILLALQGVRGAKPRFAL